MTETGHSRACWSAAFPVSVCNTLFVRAQEHKDHMKALLGNERPSEGFEPISFFLSRSRVMAKGDAFRLTEVPVSNNCVTNHPQMAQNDDTSLSLTVSVVQEFRKGAALPAWGSHIPL